MIIFAHIYYPSTNSSGCDWLWFHFFCIQTIFWKKILLTEKKCSFGHFSSIEWFQLFYKAIRIVQHLLCCIPCKVSWDMPFAEQNSNHCQHFFHALWRRNQRLQFNQGFFVYWRKGSLSFRNDRFWCCKGIFAVPLQSRNFRWQLVCFCLTIFRCASFCFCVFFFFLHQVNYFLNQFYFQLNQLHFADQLTV